MRGTSYRHADCCVHLHVISVKCWCIDLRLGKGRSGFSLFSSPDNVGSKAPVTKYTKTWLLFIKLKSVQLYVAAEHYSLYHAFCRDINHNNSVVMRAMKSKSRIYCLLKK